MNGSVHPNRNGTMIRWPDDEIGRTSVSPCTIPITRAWSSVSIDQASADLTCPPTLSNEQGGENQADRRQQLHEDVQRRAGRVLERVADGVADDGRRVGLGALAQDVAVVV